MESLSGIGDGDQLCVHSLIQPTNDKLCVVEELPDEISLNIFSYLNAQELAKCRRINNAWCRLASDDTLLWSKNKALAKASALATASFGSEDWKKYFGTIKEASPIPQNYLEILYSPDPVDSTKKMIENWMFLLMPEEVNEKPPNLENILTIVKSKKVHETGYRFCYPAFIDADKLKPVEKSNWVLIRTVVPESRNKTFKDQVKLVTSYVEKTKVAYRIPTPREYTIFNFAAYAKYGKRPYGNNPWTYGRSPDMIDGHHIVVGGFSPDGLCVFDNHSHGENFGVGLLRKF